jgi:hypothetical protein
MYYLIGAKGILETVILLARPYMRTGESLTRESLRRAYITFLNTMQPDVPRTLQEHTAFVSDPETVSTLIHLFNADSTLDDLHRQVVNDQERGRTSLAKLDATQEAFHEVGVDNPDFGEMLSFITSMIYCARSSVGGGGTSSNAIGVIWADHRPSWSYRDKAEFFLHELTHSLMFLDELRYQHYTDLADAWEPKYFALSAVLATRRPLDKVLHSLVVATEVLLGREQWLGHPESPRLHPPSPVMLQSCLKTIDSIESSPVVMGRLLPRGQALVALCKARVLEVAERYAQLTLVSASAIGA